VFDCNTNYTLNYNYYSDHDGSDPDPHKDVWDFTSGNSAGVCKDDNLFYIADTSDLRQPFDDGFVKFNVSADGVGGSGVVPYLPPEFFDGAKSPKWIFHQIWFFYKNPARTVAKKDSKAIKCWEKIGYKNFTLKGKTKIG
jgi:hypothetical protein